MNDDVTKLLDALDPLQRKIFDLAKQKASAESIAITVKRSVRTVRREIQRFEEELERCRDENL